MQSRTHSLIEAIANNAIAFVISVLANQLVLPAFGISVSLSQSIGIAIVFTIISVIRSYCVRRVFNQIGAKA